MSWGAKMSNRRTNRTWIEDWNVGMAADDMYDALCKLVRACRRQGIADDHPAMTQAKAALAKARGETA